MLGQTVSHYRILEKLGGGGMGVVYRAEDERLKRSVAIKVLPPELTRDREAKARFVLEAQAASALDHPNICTIYEIDETPDGQMFLAMAYYAGETLKRKIERGPMKLDDALDYGIQIAQALKKAHEHGIVHRDIKPANVLVTGDALIKVLDFGLAKLVSQSGLTRTGTVLGTVSYMSPEQALGQIADARSDLWSLGVVLHEMIAGQLPFRGDSEMAVVSAIAHSAAPPLTSLRAGLPLELDRVVGRMLAKSPDDRYQTAADLLSELRRLRRESGGHSAIGQQAAPGVSGAPGQTTQPPRVRRRTWSGLAVAALVLGAVVIGYLLAQHRGVNSPPPELTNPVQVAATIAVERSPDWSPNGSMIAYHAADGPYVDIWINQLGGGPPVNRTADNPSPDMFPRWSPDGLQIAFSSQREGNGIYVMPALAGAPRKIVSRDGLVLAPPVWSPLDTAELGYTVAESGVVYLERQNLRDGSKRRAVLDGRKGNERVDLAWSPDGKFIAYVDARNYTAQVTQIWILRLADGRSTALTDGRTNDWSPTWAPDSRTVYLTSNRGGAMDIWQLRIAEDGSPGGGAERLTSGLEVASIALSEDGRRLAYSKGRWLANAFRVPILPDKTATWTDAQQLTFDQAHVEYVDLSHDGQRLAISSDRSGNPDIWIIPAAGGEIRPFVTDSTPDWNPAWSPEDKEIAFYAYRSGNREIWVQPLAGGPPRQLTSSDSESVFPRWADRGKSIIYNKRSGGSSDIWSVPAAGGDATEVLGGPPFDAYPDASPDGQWIAFESNRDGVGAIWRMTAAGDNLTRLSSGPGTRPHWSGDSKTVYFIRFELPAAIRNIWSVSVDTKAERRLTDFKGKRGLMEGNAFATDGRFAYFTWRDDVGDVWIMDVVARK